jgi:hypothetical protein
MQYVNLSTGRSYRLSLCQVLYRGVVEMTIHYKGLCLFLHVTLFISLLLVPHI